MVSICCLKQIVHYHRHRVRRELVKTLLACYQIKKGTYFKLRCICCLECSIIDEGREDSGPYKLVWVTEKSITDKKETDGVDTPTKDLGGQKSGQIHLEKQEPKQKNSKQI